MPSVSLPPAALPRTPLTPAQVEELGDAVGRIAVYAARSLVESYPHLDLERLVATFTGPSAVTGSAHRYLYALEGGATPAEAAGQVGTELIRVWARTCLDVAQGARTARSV